MRCLYIATALLLLTAGSSFAQSDLRLITALKNQDVAAAKTLIRQRAGINSSDVDGSTPLQWAAHWDNLELVKQLIAGGAKPNAANRYGVTPLHEAATIGSAPVVGALLKSGAQADAVYGEGETPLMLAARSGNLESVKLLIEASADVNAAETFRGQTALMLATVEDHAPIVKALLAAGAKPDTRAVEYKFQALTGGAGGIIHDRPQGGITALMLAARQGARASGAALLDAGADAKAAEPQYGFTALQTAIFNGHYAFAKMLVERGADVNDGALYVAIEMRNLAKYTNRPNPPDAEDGVSHLDIVKLLLEKGADPNAVYTKKIPPRQAQGDITVTAGSTALYRAVRSVDLATVNLLLAAGAKPEQPIFDGSTPLMLIAGLGAPRRGEEDVTEAGNRSDPLDVVKALLDRGAHVNGANDVGMTALHFAVQRGNDRLVEFLAAKGARFDVKNKQGKTPADLARGKTAELVTKLTAQ